MRPIKTTLVLLFLLLNGCCSPQYDPIHVEEPGNGKVSRTEMLFEHNLIRVGKKLGELQPDEELDKKAQEHAEWMAKSRNLRHSKLGGTKFSSMGENIAMGYETVGEVMAGWMSSRGHRANILTEDYTHAGTGVAYTDSGTGYYCVVFGGGR